MLEKKTNAPWNVGCGGNEEKKKGKDKGAKRLNSPVFLLLYPPPFPPFPFPFHSRVSLPACLPTCRSYMSWFAFP